MIKGAIYFGIALLVFSACDNRQPATDGTENPVSNHASAHQSTMQTMDTPDIVTLNNGQKWQANKETTDGISQMTSILASLPAAADVEDCRSLQARLEKEFEGILKKCTMTGEAHNQLHNYLLPMQELIGQLGSDSTGNCKETVKVLNAHLMTYNDYFQ